MWRYRLPEPVENLTKSSGKGWSLGGVGERSGVTGSERRTEAIALNVMMDVMKDVMRDVMRHFWAGRGLRRLTRSRAESTHLVVSGKAGKSGYF